MPDILPSPRVRPQQSVTHQDSTVFVVDGDPATRDSVSALAAPMNIATAGYSSAEEFLNSYDGGKSGCLITTLRMVGMSGLELQQTLRDRNTPLPTIVLTAFADVQSAVEVMQLGAFTLLEKPCRDAQLWDAIRKALVLDAKQRALRERNLELCSRVESLTQRERQVMDMLVEGVPNKTIASRLQLSLRTIEMRRSDVYRKLGASSIAQLVSLVREAERPICVCNFPHARSLAG